MSSPSPNFLTCPIDPPPKQVSGSLEQTPLSSGDSEKPSVSPTTPASDHPTPRKTRRLGCGIATLVGLGMLIVTLPATLSLIRASRDVLTTRAAMQSAQEQLKRLDIGGATTDIDQARASLSDLRETLHNVGLLRDLPGIGTQIRALEDAAAAGSGTLDSAGDVLSVVRIVVEALQGGVEATGELTTGIAPTRSFSQLSREEKRDLLARFSGALPRLRLARDKMDLALELWQRVPQDRLAEPIRSALQPMAEALPALKRSLDEAVPMIEVLVPMAGYPEPQRSIIALQNATELRPGGGFIGTIGMMTWDAGDLSEFAFTDVYNIDNPVSGVWKEVPPQPLKSYLGAQQWFLRDANWSPDFPTSAERVLDFMIRESELQLHAPLPNRPTNFIAFEPGFFEALLRLTGPITVDGDTYDSKTFIEKLEYKVEVAWHEQGVPVEKRKEVISSIGNELAKKMFALPASRWPEVLDVITKALERKQAMVYSRKPELQALLDVRGWTARVVPTNGDFLMVADANLAALKTDGAMAKSIRYHVDMKNSAGPTATVTLSYTNTAKGFSDYRYTRYRSYTRVYVPEGSQLISSSGAMANDIHNTGGRVVPGTVDVMRELGKTVFGAFWSVEPGKTGTLSFTYRLPSTVLTTMQNGTYHLDWLKQPGADATRLTLDLLFGKNILSATPSEPKEWWGDARYQTEADSLTNHSFNVSF